MNSGDNLNYRELRGRVHRLETIVEGLHESGKLLQLPSERRASKALSETSTAATSSFVSNGFHQSGLAFDVRQLGPWLVQIPIHACHIVRSQGLCTCRASPL